MKYQIMSIFLATLLTTACTDNINSEAEIDSAEQVTIYRDKYDTPHIVASSNRGVYFGYGYAVATDRMFQMEMLKRTAEGRVAEVLGQEFVELDSHLRTSYDHRSIQVQLKMLPANQLEILEAYAAGFNTRIDELTEESMPGEFSDNGFLPEHWNAYNVAMTFVGSIAHRYSDFNSERDNLELLQHLEKKHGKATAWRIFNSSKWLHDSDSPTTVPGRQASPTPISRPDYLDELSSTTTTRVVLSDDGRFDGTTRSTQKLSAARQRLADLGFSHNPEFTGASNYWAARDLQDAPAALVNGPQFGFGVPSYVYGIGLHGGDFNVVGNTLLALPSLLFAHNNHIAWGSTAGMSDQSDEYMLSLDPNNPEQYQYAGNWQTLESWPEVIRVKGMPDVTVMARRSVQGMVQDYQPHDNIAWARARSWEGEELATLMAWIFLATDTTLEKARQRIAAMATNINMYTMDNSGNLAYIHSGRYPLRANGHDSRLPTTGSGQWDWQGMRPKSDNPTVTNPEQGYIANWNNRPQADWISSDLWTYTWSRADRVRLIFDALQRKPEGNSAAKLSVADISDINEKIAYADVNAPFLLPYLFSAFEADKPTQLVAEALALLQSWDRQWRLGDNGQYGSEQAVMESWLKELLREVIADDVGAEYFYLYSATNYPNSTLGASMGTAPGTKVVLRNLDRLASGELNDTDYDFFNGRDPAGVIRQSFTAALDKLGTQLGNDVSAWRLKAAPMQWQPYNFRGVPQAQNSAAVTLPAYMNRGSENNLFVATGDSIEAWDVIPPGQSGFQTKSGDRDANSINQLEMYASFEYKPVPFDIVQVRELAVSTTTITVSDLIHSPNNGTVNFTQGDNNPMRSITAIHDALSIGSTNTQAVVEQSLMRVKASANLNAFITVDENGARSTAKEQDSIRNNGVPQGRLAGIPVGIKDNIHVAGLANTAGTAALRDFVPTTNASVIDSLKSAGAIIIGKNNMHELAYGITSNNYSFGAVGNAYNPQYIAGGSSGGTAVAIASGMVTAGLGTDTGGSTRIPASLNGIAGFRPTTGRYPVDGLTRISSTRDTVGPMANTVADIALLDSVLSGGAIYTEGVQLSELRLGVPRDYFYHDLEPDVAARVEVVLNALDRAGVELVEVDIKNLGELNEQIGFPLVLFETRLLLEEYAKQNISGGSLQSIVDKLSSPDVQGVMANVMNGDISEAAYREALDVYRPKLKQAYRSYFSENTVDAIIFPTLPLTARPIEGSLETVELNGERVPTFPTYIRNTDPASNAGIPALTIPAGLSTAGLPIGIEIDGPENSDQRLLAIGIAIEALLHRTPVTQTPPPN